jgi:hypothetical protein
LTKPTQKNQLFLQWAAVMWQSFGQAHFAQLFVLAQTAVLQVLHDEAGQAFFAQSAVEQVPANAAAANMDTNNIETKNLFMIFLLFLFLNRTERTIRRTEERLADAMT